MAGLTCWCCCCCCWQSRLTWYECSSNHSICVYRYSARQTTTLTPGLAATSQIMGLSAILASCECRMDKHCCDSNAADKDETVGSLHKHSMQQLCSEFQQQDLVRNCRMECLSQRAKLHRVKRVWDNLCCLAQRVWWCPVLGIQ